MNTKPGPLLPTLRPSRNRTILWYSDDPDDHDRASRLCSVPPVPVSSRAAAGLVCPSDPTSVRSISDSSHHTPSRTPTSTTWTRLPAVADPLSEVADQFSPRTRVGQER